MAEKKVVPNNQVQNKKLKKVLKVKNLKKSFSIFFSGDNFFLVVF